MGNLSPWQLLLWIAGVELITLPLVIFCGKSIIHGYFESKREYLTSLLNAAGKTIEQMVKDGMPNKEETRNGKEEQKEGINSAL